MSFIPGSLKNSSATAGREKVLPRLFCMGGFSLFALICALILFVFASPAIAAVEGRVKVKIAKVKPGTKLLFESEKMTYYKGRDTVVATGNVHLYYGPYALRADRIDWMRRTDKVIAKGNVVFRDANGNLVNAPYAVLVDKFREGFLRSVSVVFTNNAKLAGVSAERYDGNITILNKAVYSPCKTCQEHPEKAPLWQIKAVKVTHDEAKKTIYYKDAKFEFFGTPIAYLPYFSHPDPTVKRKTGLITPGLSFARHYGAGLTAPLFINLAPNYDLTLSPTFTTRQGLLGQFEWRHRTKTGAYFIRPTGIYEFNWYGPDTGRKRIRGSLESAGRFAFNKTWSWGWNLWAVSDDTFLNSYGLESDSDLVSDVFLTGLSGRNYFNAQAFYFRGLLATDRKSTTPVVHPVIDYNLIFSETVFGGEMGFDANVMSLSRTKGADSNRLSADLHWKRTFTSRAGVQTMPFWSLRGDVYNTRNVAGSPNATDNFVRVMPSIGVEYSWPFISLLDWGAQTFTPVAQIIASPGEVKAGRISNEDSQTIEFDDINLFSRNKFDGLDRVEGGVRASLGFKYRVEHASGGYAAFTFGEAFHLAGRNSFGADTGLQSARSDFVGGLQFYPFKGFSLGSRLRLDKNTFAIKRHELDIEGRYGRLWGKALYTRLKAQPAQGMPLDREEVDTKFSFNLNDNWKVLAGARYDIENNDIIEESFGINYDDECFNATLSVENRFTRDRDIKRDFKVSLSVVLKTVGGSSVSTTANRAVR